MKKIEIKLKECCLTCEHFDPSGCSGVVPTVFCCDEPDRVIACGHMAVCKEYLELHPPSCCELEKREIIPQKTGWISVKDGLPEEMEQVVVCTENKDVGFGRHTTLDGDSCWFTLFGVGPVDDERYYTATHWMPLPEPPK